MTDRVDVFVLLDAEGDVHDVYTTKKAAEDEIRSALIGEGMSDEEAEEYAEDWRVISAWLHKGEDE